MCLTFSVNKKEIIYKLKALFHWVFHALLTRLITTEYFIEKKFLDIIRLTDLVKILSRV